MHLINRLYQSEFDFPRTDAPATSFMVATIPRSGSTYFAVELWKTGVLGAPMEYLNFPAMGKQLMPRLGSLRANPFELSRKSVRRYWNRVKGIRTSPNGVFGYKMFMIMLRDLIAHYPDIFEDILPDYIVYLTRADEVGQAISYARAKTTNVWFANVAHVPPVTYDFEHIRRCRDDILYQKQYWEEVFKTAGVAPLRVTYEELLSDSHQTIRRVLSHLGMIDDPNARLEIPNVDRQSDAVTSEWRDRYMEDLARWTETHHDDEPSQTEGSDSSTPELAK